MSIPKILHQIWIGPLPAPINLMKTWKDKHPDFEYILWNEEEIRTRNLQMTCTEEINLIPEINGKADIIRWEILYQYGGYFVDADSICIEPFDSFFENKTAFATFENESVRKGLIATGTMGFIPMHPLCKDIIEWIKSSESKKIIQETRAWYSVGPALLTRMLETKKYKDVTIYPSYCFLPIHFTGPKYEGHKKVYGYQEWGTAKQSYETMNQIVLPEELLEPKLWVSVLITSYNTNIYYIKECLQSMRNQNGHFGIELVWVNDGSNKDYTNGLEKELDSFRQNTRFIKVIYKYLLENKGTAYACNRGLELCTNEIVFKMDSDDIMLPDRMKIQIDYMTKNPEIICCGANIRMFSNPNPENLNEKKFEHNTNHPEKMIWDLFYKTRPDWFINHPTICYRKSKILDIGGYDENNNRLKIIHDYELIVRILKKYGTLYNLPDTLLYYRLHQNQLTYRLQSFSKENIELRNDIIETANRII
jgi:GT2 family glycosyltransferase